MYEVVIVYKDHKKIDSVWDDKDSASHRLESLASKWSRSETAFGYVRERWDVFVVHEVDADGSLGIDSIWSSSQDAINRVKEIRENPRYRSSYYEAMTVNRIV